MPGPAPKSSAVRQRRNRQPGARTLVLVPTTATKAPPLPRRGKTGWLKATRDWWADIWASPMAAAWLDSDVHELLILAALVDAYWRSPSEKLAGEIRRQRQCFGLTPLDRSKLHWEIARGEEAAERTTKRRSKSKTDAREALGS